VNFAYSAVKIVRPSLSLAAPGTHSLQHYNIITFQLIIFPTF
jgi:hypothetical protein